MGSGRRSRGLLVEESEGVQEAQTSDQVVPDVPEAVFDDVEFLLQQPSQKDHEED